MTTGNGNERARIKKMLLLNTILVFLGSLILVLAAVYCYWVYAVKKDMLVGVFLVVLPAGGLLISLLAVSLNRAVLRHFRKTDEIRKRLDQQMEDAVHMSPLGLMAAGVVHEINNPLQIIQSEEALIEMNLGSLKESGLLEPSKTLGEIEDSLAQIRKQVRHCAGIAQSVLTFGRKDSPEVEPVLLQDLIPEVILPLAGQARPNRIRMEMEIPADLPPVSGNASQLGLVLLNLVNNSIYAIAEHHGVAGGLIKVTAQKTEIGKVTVSVTDNGAGIGPEDLDRVFTPFFSTKPSGKGTGLGLSVCRGIIENLGGSMNVNSPTKEGATFHIHLREANPSRPPAV